MVLVLQEVQVLGRHILSCSVSVGVEGDGFSALHLTGRCHDNATILGEIIIAVVVVAVLVSLLCAVAGIDITQVTAAKDIAITLGHAGSRTYLATIDVDIGLSEDIAARANGTETVQVVETTTAAEDILEYLTLIHIYVRLAWLVYGYVTVGTTGSASYGTNLAATVCAVAHHAAIEIDVGEVGITVVGISATKDVTGSDKALVVTGAVTVIEGLIANLLLVRIVLIFVTYVAVIERYIGSAVNNTAFATTIGITLYGRNAI